MKTILSMFLVLVIMLTSCDGLSDEIVPTDNNSKATQIDALPREPLSDKEAAALVFMREEEKMARDVYDYLYMKWSAKPFDNISSSEQSHMDAVLVLIDKYDLQDPAIDDLPGKFFNANLQALYDDLIESGSVSKEEAFKVGAAIEEIDILDLQRELATNIDNEDIKIVFENLMKGSRNHLRAFVKNLTNLGLHYSPQYLTQAAFDEIVNAEMEHG